MSVSFESTVVGIFFSTNCILESLQNDVNHYDMNRWIKIMNFWNLTLILTTFVQKILASLMNLVKEILPSFWKFLWFKLRNILFNDLDRGKITTTPTPNLLTYMEKPKRPIIGLTICRK